ncbi:MAG: hypothetical protein ACREJB_17675 [Planctomycetaceae bacterium]
MTLTLTLTPELEQSLTREAERRGMPVDEFALQLLERHVPPENRRRKAVALLQSWIDEGSAEDQETTSDDLIQALDDDRLSDRPLFPDELKDVTW